MEFKELVKVRQSQRSFSDQPVEKEKIDLCIESTRLAPSAVNGQPWKFIIVDDPTLVSSVADTTILCSWAHQAKLFIAVVLEGTNTISRIGSLFQKKDYRLIDLGIAINQFCLQASDLGLGTCIMGMFQEKPLKRLLDVPSVRRLPIIIAVGYPDTPPRPKQRKPLFQISSRNRF